LDAVSEQWDDCIKSGHIDETIPPLETEDYIITGGMVCLNPTGLNYDALKRFFRSHRTLSNRQVENRYDEYVYSDFDEAVLPKNIRVLSYALSEGEFANIFFEAIALGEIENFIDVDAAFFDFMYAAAHIPAFCGEKSADDPRDIIEVCRQELVFFLLDVVANSRYDDVAQDYTGITEIADRGCVESLALGDDPNCQFRFSMLVVDEQYLMDSTEYFFRRGFGAGVQGAEEYATLSTIVFGDRTVLLNEPWLVEEDLSLAYGAAMYKWMHQRSRSSQVHYPSGHEIATGIWAGSTDLPTQNINTLIELSL